MNVVDSSGWLEYFADSSNAHKFAPFVEDTGNLVVPSISIYEVFKHFCLHRDESQGLKAVAQMLEGLAVELDSTLALEASKLSIAHKLPMADSIILATARAFHATLVTQDADFKGIEGVEYFEK